MIEPGLIDDSEAWDRTFNALLELRRSHHQALLNVEAWLLRAGVIQEHERLAFTRVERRRLTRRKENITM